MNIISKHICMISSIKKRGEKDQNWFRPPHPHVKFHTFFMKVGMGQHTYKKDQRYTAPTWCQLGSFSQLLSASNFQTVITSFSV